MKSQLNGQAETSQQIYVDIIGLMRIFRASISTWHRKGDTLCLISSNTGLFKIRFPGRMGSEMNGWVESWSKRENWLIYLRETGHLDLHMLYQIPTQRPSDTLTSRPREDETKLDWSHYYPEWYMYVSTSHLTKKSTGNFTAFTFTLFKVLNNGCQIPRSIEYHQNLQRQGELLCNLIIVYHRLSIEYMNLYAG